MNVGISFMESIRLVTKLDEQQNPDNSQSEYVQLSAKTLILKFHLKYEKSKKRRDGNC